MEKYRLSTLIILIIGSVSAQGCGRGEVEKPAVDELSASNVVMVEPVDEGSPFEVPSDSQARYRLLKVGSAPGGNIISITRRDGPSGRSYARREIDCSRRLFRYLGEGDTLEEALIPRSYGGNNGMSELVSGSIADVVVDVTCAKASS